MDKSSFSDAIRVIDDAKRRPSGEATKLMFDHFNTASQSAREAFVTALIGDVLTSHVRRTGVEADRNAHCGTAGETAL